MRIVAELKRIVYIAIGCAIANVSFAVVYVASGNCGGFSILSPGNICYANTTSTLSFANGDTFIVIAPGVETSPFFNSYAPVLYANGANATIIIDSSSNLTNKTGGAVLRNSINGGLTVGNSGNLYATAFNSANSLMVGDGFDNPYFNLTNNFSGLSVGTIVLSEHYSGAITLNGTGSHTGDITMGRNNYSIIFNNTGSVIGNISVAAGTQTINTSISALTSFTNATLGGTVSNVRRFYLEFGAQLTSGGTISGLDTSLVISSQAAFHLGHQLTGAGTVTNNGTLNLNAPAIFTMSGGVTNNGTLKIAGALTSGCTISNNGTVNVTANNSTATITNNSTGQINLNATLTGGSINNSGTVNVNAGPSVNITNNSTGTINIAAALSGPSLITNAGRLNVNSGGSITGTLTGNSSTTSLYLGNASAVAFTTGGAISNIPTISLVTTGTSLTASSAISGVSSIFNVTSGTSATFTAGLSASGSTATVENAGTMTFNAGGSIASFSEINLSGSGKIVFNTNANLNAQPITGTGISGSTELDVGNSATLQTSASISDLGTISIAGTSTLALNSGGSISNVNSVTLATGCNLQLNSGSSISNFNNLALNGTSLLTINNGATFTLTTNNNITGTGTLRNLGQLTMDGSSVTFTGSFENKSTGTFQIDGTPTINFNGATFQNLGNILINFSTTNSLPQINTLASGGGLDLSHGTITIGYNNNYIAGGNYTFFTAGSTPSPGAVILPPVSTYITNWALNPSGNDLVVTVTRSGFGAHALTPEAQAIGNYLEQIGANATSPSQLNLLNALEDISDPQELTTVLESLMPPQYTMLVTLQMLDTVMGALDVRMAKQNSGYSSGDVVMSDRYGMWARPFYSNGNQVENGNLQPYNDICHGWIIGMDRTINANLTLGIAGSIAETDVYDTNTPSTKTNIHTYLGTFYGTLRSNNDVYVDALLSGGTNNYHGYRYVILPDYTLAATSNYSTQQLTVKIAASKNIAIQDFWQLTPRVMAQYSFLRQYQYVESGAGDYNVITDPENTNLFRLGAGGDLAIPFVANGMISIPGVYFMAYVDAKGGADTVNEQFITGGPVLTNTVQSSKLMLRYGVSYELKINDSLELVAAYDRVYRRGFSGNEALLNVRFMF